MAGMNEFLKDYVSELAVAVSMAGAAFFWKIAKREAGARRAKIKAIAERFRGVTNIMYLLALASQLRQSSLWWLGLAVLAAFFLQSAKWLEQLISGLFYASCLCRSAYLYAQADTLSEVAKEAASEVATDAE